MKSKIEIINETVEYYSGDTSRRALNRNGFCTYLTRDGKMCAFGRCCINPEYLNTIRGTVLDLKTYLGDLDEVLREEYRGHSAHFWREIQLLHDTHSFWGKDELTPDGRKKVEQLLRNFY